MTALVVALVVQVVWEVVRAVLIETVVSPRDIHVNALGFALTIATALVVAAAATDLGRRLSGIRRSGMWVAAGAYFGYAACIALREGLAFRAHDNADAIAWIMWMYHYGWCALDVVAVVGFAMASGRRGLWVAPPAVGLAVASERPAFLGHAEALAVAIALLAVRLVLVLAMAADASRTAVPREPAHAKAQCGLRRIEISAWIYAVLSLTWALPGFTASSERAALTIVGTDLAGGALFLWGAWTLAQASVRDVARWPLYLSVTCTLWELARLARSWFLTFTHLWGRWDEGHFTTLHWSYEVAGKLAAASALGVLVVLARRTRSRETLMAAIIAGVALVIVSMLRFTVPENRTLMAACFFASNVLAARAYRTARPTLDVGLARARVL